MKDSEKWAAVRENDAVYDGRFFYAVKTTRIFCRPSCMSKTPLPENVTYFTTAAEALKSDYRPCKRCRPDLPQYQPVKEIAEQIKGRVDNHLEQIWCFADEAAELGMTQHRMVEIFKEYYGLSISEYIKKLSWNVLKPCLKLPIIRSWKSLLPQALQALLHFTDSSENRRDTLLLPTVEKTLERRLDNDIYKYHFITFRSNLLSQRRRKPDRSLAGRSEILCGYSG